MTVDSLYKNAAFEPEAITEMTSALADICDALGLREVNGPDANKVARTVIEFAQRGVEKVIGIKGLEVFNGGDGFETGLGAVNFGQRNGAVQGHDRRIVEFHQAVIQGENLLPVG